MSRGDLGTSSSDRARVLIVEDDPALRNTLAEALRDEGYEVLTAGNGSEALEKLPTWRPHLVLLDLVMPRMNAWTFAEAQHELPEPRAPIVLMTAAAPGAARAAADIGAVEFLVKPFSIDELLEVVAYFIRYHSV